ncbi:MAG: sulfatase-like hydrolase/transferase [Draconibacterium sp.]|nr:sulfatase-like hydrolase/transferase [Draconibacterium sp.]
MKRASQNLPHRRMIKSEFHELPLKINNFKRMKSKFKVVVILLGVVILFGSCTTPTKKKESKRPNIIFLMDDQHRWDALGVINNEVLTPNLDKLAKEGVHFTQAVCQAPMCVASRYSMMLGLYPNQTGILRNEPGIPDGKLPNLTLPQALKNAGYETAGFGKTHWAVDCSTRGFETRYIGQVREKGANMMIDIDPEAKKEYDTETKYYGDGEEGNLGYIGETSSVKEENHRDGWVFNRCLEYIKDRKDERPLFLYLSFLKPHAGHNVPQGFEEPYTGKTITPALQPDWKSDLSPHAKDVNTGRRKNEPYTEFWEKASEQQWRHMTMRYYANCTWIDDMFGRTMEALKQKGLLENAIIIYVSDHGEMLGERYYRFNKYCLYESSVRVPMIFAGSALPEEFQGKTDKRPAELTDVYPTILKAAGINVTYKLPGINLLSDETRAANFCGLHERKDEAAFMWRTEKYKLILVMNKKENTGEYDMPDIIGGEFYDLKADPREWNNLYSTKEIEEQQNKMSAELIGHLKKLKRS